MRTIAIHFSELHAALDEPVGASLMLGEPVLVIGNPNGLAHSASTGIVSGLNDFTIACWVNPLALYPGARIFDFGTGTSSYMYLTTNGGSAPRFGITTGGSVYRGQIVGYFDDGGPSHRVEVVVDASPLNANSAITLTSPNSQTTTDQSTTGTDPSSSTGTSSSSTTTSSTSTQPVIGVPRILFWRDISHLGRGFSLDTLGAGAG